MSDDIEKILTEAGYEIAVGYNAVNGVIKAIPGTVEQARNPEFGTDILTPFGLPNYLCPSTGLSHLNRVERLLNKEQKEQYAIELSGVLKLHNNPGLDYPVCDWDDLFALANATAPQRLEALARTLGLDKEQV